MALGNGIATATITTTAQFHSQSSERSQRAITRNDILLPDKKLFFFFFYGKHDKVIIKERNGRRTTEIPWQISYGIIKIYIFNKRVKIILTITTQST